MKKILFIISLSVTICNFTYAQFYLGGNLSFAKYLGGSDLKSIGLGLSGEFSPDQEMSLTRIGINYGLKTSYDETYSAEAIDFSTSPQYIDVTGKSKIGFFNIMVDYKRFFGDGDYEAGGFYGFFGVGLSIATISYTADAFDESKYRLLFNIDEKEKYMQFTIRGGLGYDIELGFGNFYGEAFVNVPANNVAGQYVAISIPMSFGIQAGIRVPIGG